VSQAEGVLITGVYGSGKSSVAAEIAYLIEQHGEQFALLDLEDVTTVNDRPVHVVSQEIMTFLGWL
jgi:adenylylsulfate kinase-like enzyme